MSSTIFFLLYSLPFNFFWNILSCNGYGMRDERPGGGGGGGGGRGGGRCVCGWVAGSAWVGGWVTWSHWGGGGGRGSFSGCLSKQRSGRFGKHWGRVSPAGAGVDQVSRVRFTFVHRFTLRRCSISCKLGHALLSALGRSSTHICPMLFPISWTKPPSRQMSQSQTWMIGMKETMTKRRALRPSCWQLKVDVDMFYFARSS